jgi:hypothetical protein
MNGTNINNTGKREKDCVVLTISGFSEEVNFVVNVYQDTYLGYAGHF